jgi:serine/threonine protein kinase
MYIVKRTVAEMCQIETINLLAHEGEIIGRSRLSVSIDAPLAVWKTDEHVCELRKFHPGIGLDRIVLKNRYKITGEFLGRFHNAFVFALQHLHELGIVHRDIQPRNIFLTTGANIILLDSTLACAAAGPQFPVDSLSYTAPEQRQCQATFSSDLYSLAATEFFMTNGLPPDAQSAQRFRKGLEKVDYGNWYTVVEDLGTDDEELDIGDGVHGLFLKAFLREERERRPHGLYEQQLHSSSRPSYSLKHDVCAVLDLLDLGFLICGSQGYQLIERAMVDHFFRDVLRVGGARTSNLREDIESHLSGEPLWWQ